MPSYAVKTGSRQSILNTENAIRAMEPFKTSGAMYAERGGNNPWGSRLPIAAQEDYERVANHILYTVYSYATPIAWAYRATDEFGNVPEEGQPMNRVQWVLVFDKFSATTTSHQSRVRSALGGHEGWSGIDPLYADRVAIPYFIAGEK